MKQHRKILWISIGILGVLIVSISGLLLMFSLKSSSTKKRVVTYTLRSQPDKVFQGVVTPEQETSENLDTNLGTLVSINVKDGQPVKIGDSLLTYTANNTDMISLQYAVKNAKLTLSHSQKTLNNTII
ncbi:biotin/lipoyl-binding protein [Lactococcus ileimucosae]|uniref:biotin/lipoyl-binding protein n=1 Tax=Lactococcus ileimucosae TaxID=2941329 RepID=UPI0035140E0C